ncbi:hypothetical protein RB595_000764 [Gaeumannomyces hyphopodioides]
MRVPLAVVSGSLLVAVSQAIEGVVQFDIERRQLQPHPRLDKRALADTFEEVITNDRSRGGYFLTCAVGNPPQNLTLQLDTGSSDIWVPASSACKPSAKKPNGCSLGSFTPSDSKGFKTVGKNKFSIQYLDGTHSKGDYFTDRFAIGSATVANLTMGLGLDGDIPYGLAGIGYPLNEAIVTANSSSSPYPNLPATMMNDGMIRTNAYSLWLNDLQSSTGNILFGGIDTEKYKGNLTRIKIYEDSKSGNYTSFLVALTSLEAHSNSGKDVLTSKTFPIPVVLDSGTTLSYLPQDLAQQTWRETGAVWSDDMGLAMIPCSMQKSKGIFEFWFAGPNGPRIQVQMDELVLEMTEGLKFTAGIYKGQKACTFGMQNFTGDPFILGDTFLRSAYVVYDLVNNEIGIAPTDFNSTSSNIIPFPSSGAPVPSATVAPNQEQATVKPLVTSPAFVAQMGFYEGVSRSAAPPMVLGLGIPLLAAGATLIFSMAW